MERKLKRDTKPHVLLGYRILVFTFILISLVYFYLHPTMFKERDLRQLTEMRRKQNSRNVSKGHHSKKKKTTGNVTAFSGPELNGSHSFAEALVV